MLWGEHISEMMRAEVVRAEVDKRGVVQDLEIQFPIVSNESNAPCPQHCISPHPPRMFCNENSSSEEEDRATYSIP